MRDPILTSKSNRLQLFACCTSSPEAEFRNRNIKAFPPEHLLITVQINAVPVRGRWQILPNRRFHFDCRPGIEFSRPYTVYLFEGTFSKSIKQKLMLCI